VSKERETDNMRLFAELWIKAMSLESKTFVDRNFKRLLNFMWTVAVDNVRHLIVSFSMITDLDVK
jgi:hypothetical protein